MFTKHRILIYGANGYTGRRIAHEANQQIRIAGLPPPSFVLCGRDAAAVGDVASEHRLDWRICALEERKLLLRALADVAVVVNAAGPFVHTAKPLAEACIEAGAHYLDISGELAVSSELDDLHDAAARSGVWLMPGVAHTPLVATFLARLALEHYSEELPHLERFTVAHSRLPRVARGTMRTMAGAVEESIEVLDHGSVRKIRVGERERVFAFGLSRPVRKVCSAANLMEVSAIDALLQSGVAFPPDVASQMRGRLWSVEAFVEASTVGRMSMLSAAAMRYLALDVDIDRDCNTRAGRLLRTGARRARDAVWRIAPSAVDLASVGDENVGTSHEVILEVSDRYRRSRELRLLLPDAHRFTARAAIAMAMLMRGSDSQQRITASSKPPEYGYRIPGLGNEYSNDCFRRPFRGARLRQGTRDKLERNTTGRQPPDGKVGAATTAKKEQPKPPWFDACREAFHASRGNA